MAESLEDAFDSLSKFAVVFSSLSALFGVYIVLFTLAVYHTQRRKGASYKRLQVVTILLFADLLLHYTTRALILAQFRNPNPPSDEQTRWTIPLLFFGSITVTIAGLLSDGLVAWRFYVIYERRKWALFVPTIIVLLNAILGFVGDFEYLGGFSHPTGTSFINLLHVSFTIQSAWGWCMFGLNTLLTSGIIGKILWVARKVPVHGSLHDHRLPYAVVVEAIVESALVNCVGLMLYELATIAPTGHIEASFGIGYVMYCILPVFFGISQCLITVRLCMVESRSNPPSTSRLMRSLGTSDRGRQGSTSEPRSSIPDVIFLTPTKPPLSCPEELEKKDLAMTKGGSEDV